MLKSFSYSRESLLSGELSLVLLILTLGLELGTSSSLVVPKLLRLLLDLLLGAAVTPPLGED